MIALKELSMPWHMQHPSSESLVSMAVQTAALPTYQYERMLSWAVHIAPEAPVIAAETRRGMERPRIVAKYDASRDPELRVRATERETTALNTLSISRLLVSGDPRADKMARDNLAPLADTEIWLTPCWAARISKMPLVG